MEAFGKHKSPRIERALNLLADEAFDRVVDVINAELDEHPDNSYAYWLQLLAERQCVDENTLVQRGIPFTKEKTYGYVCRYADDDEKKHYQEIAEHTLFFTHTKVLLCATQGDTFRMQKWIGHYADHCKENDKLNDLHKMMEKAGGLTEVNDYTLGVLAILYHIYSALEQQAAGAAVTTQIGGLYTQCVDKMMTRIHQTATVSTKNLNYQKGPEKADENLRKNAAEVLDDPEIRRLTDPVGVWNACDGKPGLPDTMPDGTPTQKEQRIALLIKQLQKAPVWEVGRYAVIDALYDQIDDEQGRAAFHRSILERKNITDIELQYLTMRSVDKQAAAWQYITKLSGNFSVSLPYMGEVKEVEKFLKNGLREHTKRKEIQKTLEQCADRTKSLEETLLAPLRYWAQVATQAQDSPYKAPWQAYTEKVHSAVEERIKACRDLREKVRAAIETYDQGIVDKAQGTGKKAAVVSLVALGLGVLALLWALVLLLKPELALSWSLIGIFGISAGVSLLLFIILLAVQNAQKEKKKVLNDSILAKYTSGCRTITNLAPVFTCLVGLATLAVLVYGFLTAGTRTGPQTISGPEDLAKLNQFPSGRYVLTEDVDMAGQPLPEVSVFLGTVDGNGFALKNVNQQDTVWIKTNMGQVQNLTLQDSTLAKPLVESNQGELQALTIQNTVLAKALIEENKGLICNATVTDVSFRFPETLPWNPQIALLVELNQTSGTVAQCHISGGGITVEGDLSETDQIRIGTVAARNSGNVIACHSAAPIALKGSWNEDNMPQYFIGGLVGDGADGAVTGASYTGTISGTLEDNGTAPGMAVYIGGIAGTDAKVTQSFFDGELTLKLSTTKGTGYGDYFVGALAGSGSVTDCYAKGKLTVENTVKTKKNVNLVLGALVGKGSQGVAVTSCYHNLKVSVTNKLKGEKEASYNYCKLVGVASEIQADALQSFVYGTKKVKKVWGKQKLQYQKCYVAKALSLDLDKLKGTGELTVKKDVLDPALLGWNTDIWVLEAGKLPELKPVAYAQVPAETTGEPATETTASEEAA